MPSDLTTSGLLYEGNFDDWLPRMSAILSQQHGCTITLSGAQPLLVSGNTNRKAKADTILAQASPYIITRIPTKSRKDPTKLIRALRETACPFGFMDLPPEIRSQIYSFVIPSQTNPTRINLAMGSNQDFDMRCEEGDRVPVLCISQQMRAEALPLYYRHRQFDLVWQNDDYPLNTHQQTSAIGGQERRVRRNRGELGIVIAESIQHRASALRPDTLKSLRDVLLLLPYDPIRCLGVNLVRLDGKLEIECSFEGLHDQESTSLLREHAATISGAARALNLEGEALMLFLTSRPEIWDRIPELQ